MTIIDVCECVVRLSKREKEILMHALLTECERVERAGGNQYGPLNLQEIKKLISRFQPAKLF